jgi:hypothetical protein
MALRRSHDLLPGHPRFGRGRRRTRRRSGSLILVAAAVLAAGCQTLEHGYTTADYARRALAVTSEEGARRLRMESELDPGVREFIARHGRPDILYVEDRRSVYLFYTTKDIAGVFRREFVARSEVQTLRPIPGHLLKLLPDRARGRLLANRSRSRAAQGKTARPKLVREEARSRGLAAAPQPKTGGSDWSDRRFDVDAIVRRLRTPMTAADGGVSGWQTAAGPGGVPQRTARSGNTRYEVRDDAVMATAPIARGSGPTPGHARLAYVRINRAVFGTQATAVNEQVSALAERVSMDASARTRVARRIAGRTVRIHRMQSRSWFVYSVHP